MKICVVGPAYPLRGGIAHHTTMLCRQLAERHEVNAVSFKRLYPAFLFPGKSQVEPDPSKDALAVPLIDSIDPRTWRAAARYINDRKPDWVIMQWWHPFFGMCLASLASGVEDQSRVAFICHNVLPHDNFPLRRALTLRALRHADGLIVHSKQDMEDARRIVPGCVVRHTVLPQFTLFPRQGISKEAARSKLGLAGPTVLFFGLVRKYKGLMDLIEATALVRNTDVKCLVVGEFYDEKGKYEKRVADLGLAERIRLTDRYVPSEEVEPYFAAADAVILPYRSATQSGIVQMAFRFEKPVISTAVGGLPESIDDGRTGILVPPNDPSALAEAIDRYYDDGMEARLTAGIREDAGRFSWDRVVETIEALGEQQ